MTSGARTVAISPSAAAGRVADSATRPAWPLGVLAALVAIAPFNVKPTMDAWTDLQLRPLVIVALMIVVALAVRSLLEAPRRRPDLIDSLAYAWLVAVWLSALLGDSLTLGAGGAARLSVAALLIPVTRHVVGSTADCLAVLRALALGGAVGALIGLVYWWLGTDVDGSRFFVGQVTRLGPHVRLTRPWAHANVAAMALGVTLPAAAALPRRSVRLGALCLLIVALVLTISRGGLLAAAVAAVGWLVLRRRTIDAAVVAGLGAVAVVVFLLSSAWGVRVDELGDRAFYAGAVEPPVEFVVDQVEVLIEVDVRNDSSVVWRRDGDDRVLISARWIGDDGMVWTEDRWSLPIDLAPGESVRAPLTVTPRLPVGDYRVRWDLLIDQVAYFDQFLGEAPATSRGIVERSEVDIGDLFRYELVERQVDVGRVEGWRIAWTDFRSSPLVGVGPNQFADAAQQQLTDNGQSVGAHAHNIVLQPLAAWGVLGAVPFLLLGALALRSALGRAWRSRELADSIVAVALLALVAHGLVDWPLVAITTCIPVGLMAGLALAPMGNR